MAFRKAESLARCGAVLRIVAPELKDRQQWENIVKSHEVRIKQYDHQDIKDCAIVIAATDDRTVNAAIAEDCRKAGIWVNSVDDPDNCDFFVPAVVNKGEIQIAVSTGGSSPAMSAWIAREINEMVSDRLSLGLEIISRVRGKMIENDPEGFERRAEAFRRFFETELWRGFLNGTCELTEEGVVEWISSCSD